MIKKREERYNNYEIRGVTETQYLAISHLTGKKYNVEIQKQECSCIECKCRECPCVHAIRLLSVKGGNHGLGIVVLILVLRPSKQLMQVISQVQDGLQDGPQMQQQAPPMQEDAPPMQRKKREEKCPNRARSKSATATTPSTTTTRGTKDKVGKERGRERKRSPVQKQLQCKNHKQNNPRQGGRGRGALVQEVAQRCKNHKLQKGGEERKTKRRGKKEEGGNGRGRGREFSGLYGLLFGDDNVETPSTPPVNANRESGESHLHNSWF
ncbi:hypothetical protein IFM89_021379 [Coptis chinensis]|uniref:SWIM-type domain-containing protein n=1 Tax=Coptis chinensis TaxID=261450 RepID=A0A835M5U6_9MAGN|nr:hypothetical protein IFM89_021379 [Coptis chinensis]